MCDSSSRAIGLVNLQRIDFPVCIGKRGRVVLHIILTRRGKRAAGGASAPDIAGPVATECSVKNLGQGVSSTVRSWMTVHLRFSGFENERRYRSPPEIGPLVPSRVWDLACLL